MMTSLPFKLFMILCSISTYNNSCYGFKLNVGLMMIVLSSWLYLCKTTVRHLNVSAEVRLHQSIFQLIVFQL